VGHALSYCEQLVAAIPGPVAINCRAFSADFLVHALFAAPGDIDDMLGKSRELAEFLADPTACEGDEFFGLLAMRRREKVVMGLARHGDGLQGEVPQRLLYFADHTLVEFGGRDETTRERLRARAFDGLAAGFALVVADLRQQREEARTALSMVRVGAANGSAARREALEERQRQAIAALEPENLLNGLAQWLAAPELHIYLKPASVTVDRMGVMAPDGEAGEEFTTLTFPELVARDRRQWTIVVARIGRHEALEAVRRRQDAHRYVII
jgi:hypothetical protein